MPRVKQDGEWPKNCKIPMGMRHKIIQHARGLARACIHAGTDLNYRDVDRLRILVTLPDYSRKRKPRKE